MTSSDAAKRLSDWFRRWHAPLRKFLQGRGMVRAADLDDVAQEVFLRLLRYERSELVEFPQAYLFKTASNVVAEWSIRASAARPHGAGWLETLTAEEQPEKLVSQHLAQGQIERAVSALPSRQREVLKLRFGAGLGCDEIARELNTTPRSVKRDLAKSYATLRRDLDATLLGEFIHGRE
jgi:RNA polymerase sigma-70 factor (ECF subfamily)